MKLDEIPGAMLAKAMEIYLRIAYRDTTPPAKILDVARVDAAAPLADALARDCVARIDFPNRPGVVHKYRWRLGNDRYAHMKLGLDHCSEAGDFVFVVDTHDRDFPFGSPMLHEPQFRELLAYNAHVKQTIEIEWDVAGIPTFSRHVAGYLHDRCTVADARTKTVLIVDDDESILELEQALVEEAGYRVITATGGLEALARITEDDRIDLCLLDVMMPTLDGLSVVRQARERGRATFPIIWVTALPPQRVAGGLADGHIGKPFDPDHLIEIIRRHLG